MGAVEVMDGFMVIRVAAAIEAGVSRLGGDGAAGAVVLGRGFDLLEVFVLKRHISITWSESC
jgi:hypothetical protein